MKKGLVFGLAGALLAAGYTGAVAYTSEQVDRAIYNAVERINQQSDKQPFSIVVSRSKGVFSSTYYLSVNLGNLNDLEAPRQVNLQTDYSHGFFSTHGRTLLVRNDGYSTLARHADADDTELFEANTDWHFGLFDAQQHMDTRIQTVALNIPINSRGDTLKIGALNIGMDLDGQTFSVDGRWDGMHLTGDRGSLHIDRVSLNQTGQLDSSSQRSAVLEQYDSELLFKQIVIQQNDRLMAFDNTTLHMSQQPDKNKQRLQLGLAYSVDNLTFSNAGDKRDKTLRDLKLNLSLDLDYRAAMRLTKQIEELQDSAPEQLENPQVLLAQLSALTEQGINLQLNTLQFSRQDLQATAYADVRIDGFTVKRALSDRDYATQKVNLTANLTVPAALLKDIPATHLEQNIAGLVAAGIVRHHDDNLVVDIAMNNGQLRVNGMPMPM